MPQQVRKAPSDRPDHEVLIVGTGFAGLGMAIQMKKAGMDDFVILERADDVGGTWRDNHYPGCACDIQSHLYSFSFEPNPNWSRLFAPQQEILNYLRHCTQKYQLSSRIRFNHCLVGARFDETSGFWAVQVADADAVQAYLKLQGLKPGDGFDANAPGFPPCRTLTCRVFIPAIGGLSTPAFPAIKGLERFQGKCFHSQNWDHAYDLRDKRVAVIGTGASAIQFVPQIQRTVAHLDLYQRTPPWILPKLDRPVSSIERAMFERLPMMQKLRRAGLYCLLESRGLGFVRYPGIMKQAQKMAHKHIRQQIKDPALRLKVTPSYSVGCKRVLISDDYYPALAQANVDVITSGIREVREHCVVTTDGSEREADAIILGTGFRATDPVPRGMIFGRHGQDLLDGWEDGPEAYKGTTVAGFPNLFFLVGPNTGLGHNSIIYMIESQIAYVLDALRLIFDRQLKQVDVLPEVQAEYNRKLQERARKTIWAVGGCQSWYLHPKSGKNVTLWPKFTWQFRLETQHFDPVNYELVGAVRTTK